MVMVTPTRPGADTEIDEETKLILEERARMFEQEKKAARPWPEVRAEILRKPSVS